MSVFAWALTYIGAATVSYLFMRLLDKLDRPGKEITGGKDDAGRAESGGATGIWRRTRNEHHCPSGDP